MSGKKNKVLRKMANEKGLLDATVIQENGTAFNPLKCFNRYIKNRYKGSDTWVKTLISQ
jgi:hypothetical protein